MYPSRRGNSLRPQRSSAAPEGERQSQPGELVNPARHRSGPAPAAVLLLLLLGESIIPWEPSPGEQDGDAVPCSAGILLGSGLFQAIPCMNL